MYAAVGPTSSQAADDAVTSGVSLRIEGGANPILVPMDSPLVAFSRLLQDPASATGAVSPSPLDLVAPTVDLGGLMGWPPGAGEDELRVDVKFAQAGGVALSAGTVWWVARTSGLLASMAISAPVWRGIDPLPVLASHGRSKGAEPDEGAAPGGEGDVEQVFDRSAATPPGGDIALGESGGRGR